MTRHFTRLAAVLAVAALLPTAATAQVSFFTSQANWTAALNGGSAGVDTFNDLPGVGVPSPLNRTAGSFSYVASVIANGGSPDFFPAGTAGDRWLSTDFAGAGMRFASFTAGTNAIGGEIFGSDIGGAFQNGPISVAWATTAGSGSTTLTAPSSTSFWGLVTTGTLTSLTITGVDDDDDVIWGTVNNLRLGQARPTTVIPEPSTYALVATGLVALVMVRRRRA
ncbi:MAG: PEP-CTERM sorting domain-containing protein [Gemmatimonadaceae bacterium]|jgi:hypothetical protein|nr:PEP-CTERM sorting domain-containing protein [Gemmatimonadaceae bacterium]